MLGADNKMSFKARHIGQPALGLKLRQVNTSHHPDWRTHKGGQCDHQERAVNCVGQSALFIGAGSHLCEGSQRQTA